MDFISMFNLPQAGSSHAHEIDFIIFLVHILMFALFFGWGIFLFIALFKFNRWANPKANYHGVHSHISSVIEVAVVIFEAVLLIGFSIPFWAKQVNALPERPDRLEIKVVGEQFAWNVHYPGKDGTFGKTDIQYFDKQSNPLGIDPNDPNGKDDIVTINQLHLPIGRPVIIYLTSKDVIHSFFLPEMRVKQDVIPGMQTQVWFTPTITGKFEIGCAQLCGIGHYRMKGFLTIHSPDAFNQWLDEQASAAQSEGEADDFWGF